MGEVEYDVLAREVRIARRALGMSQDAFAKIVGINKTSLVKFESKKRSMKHHLALRIIKLLALEDRVNRVDEDQVKVMRLRLTEWARDFKDGRRKD
jgi:DNA-binding XRE family transcriptional regulator